MRPPPGFGRLPGTSANDLYSVLGVTRTAPKGAIKKAFVELAKRHHPDHNSAPEAVEEFRKIQAAYSVLNNEQKRKEYDLSLPKSKDLRRSRFFDRNTRFKPGDTPFPGAAYGFEPPHKEHWRYQQSMRDRSDGKTHNYTQYRATPDFDSQRFQHKLFRNLWRAWPVMIPVWFFFVFFALRPKQEDGSKGPGTIFQTFAMIHKKI